MGPVHNCVLKLVVNTNIVLSLLEASQVERHCRSKSLDGTESRFYSMFTGCVHFICVKCIDKNSIIACMHMYLFHIYEYMQIQYGL
jgi:hypothetical protein